MAAHRLPRPWGPHNARRERERYELVGSRDKNRRLVAGIRSSADMRAAAKMAAIVWADDSDAARAVYRRWPELAMALDRLAETLWAANGAEP